MNEQWKELKETIIEMRDNDGTGTQQDACKFLANLMDVLEKQMQEPILDKIRAEIVQKSYGIANDSVIQGMKYERANILEIIDKYRKEE